MSVELERQIWDLLEAGGMTRDMLERHLPRCSSEAIRIKLLAMEGRRLIAVNTEGTFFRLQDAYKPAFIAVARAESAPAPHAQPATTNDGGEEKHMAEAKRCPQCAQTKPRTAFRKHQRRCTACLDGQPAAARPANQSKAAKAKRSPARKKGTRRASTAHKSNGAAIAVSRELAFQIPAGRAIDVDVIRGDDGIRQLELTSREPGKRPDQFLNLTRDQAIALHGFIGRLIAE